MINFRDLLYKYFNNFNFLFFYLCLWLFSVFCTKCLKLTYMINNKSHFQVNLSVEVKSLTLFFFFSGTILFGTVTKLTSDESNKINLISKPASPMSV